MKRLFDLMVSLTGLTLLAAPFAVIALAIKVSNPGTVFYRQKRIGLGGRPFWLYKFRSMRNSEGGAQVTVDGDPRITAIGRVLRRWKLDELPQLYNILRGDMSVIGPRPEVERFVQRYTAQERRVLEQIPGLAGLAQLVYPHEADLLRGCNDPEEAYARYLLPRKLAVDLQYGERRTFWSDMQLLGELALLILGKSYRTDRDFRIPPYAATRTD
jgi:lipopolysaccharide/colanic/teichoic acid biosynthesis glycosyltransferase